MSKNANIRIKSSRQRLKKSIDVVCQYMFINGVGLVDRMPCFKKGLLIPIR